MTVKAFLDWMAELGGARYELIAGEIVGMAPERAAHAALRSPGTRARDAGAKLADYFRVASIQHDLLVRTERSCVIHHRRAGEATIDTRIVTAGTLLLDPPGLTLDIDHALRRSRFPELPN